MWAIFDVLISPDFFSSTHICTFCALLPLTFGRKFPYDIFLLTFFSNAPPPFHPFHNPHCRLLLLSKKKSSATAVAATGRAAWLFLAGDSTQRIIFFGKLCQDFLESPNRNFRRGTCLVLKIKAHYVVRV